MWVTVEVTEAPAVKLVVSVRVVPSPKAQVMAVIWSPAWVAVAVPVKVTCWFWLSVPETGVATATVTEPGLGRMVMGSGKDFLVWPLSTIRLTVGLPSARKGCVVTNAEALGVGVVTALPSPKSHEYSCGTLFASVRVAVKVTGTPV